MFLNQRNSEVTKLGPFLQNRGARNFFFFTLAVLEIAFLEGSCFRASRSRVSCSRVSLFKAQAKIRHLHFKKYKKILL